MQIRCSMCMGTVAVADTGVLPTVCPHCRARPVPERLGRFVVVRLLAAGGMGEVYLGEHEQLGTRVALKLLPLPAGGDAAALRERFRREAKLTAAIDDPGVVQVLDFVEDQGRMFLVLELVDGRSLRARLRDGPVPFAEALRIAGAVARVLGKAHARGVVHRDVKPENVMLCGDGRVRVLDFGIARAVQDHEPLTRTGELLGTPEYMAPEQLLDGPESVDARTDVHALGLLAYELLTGRSAFAGASVFQALKLVESLVPKPPSALAAEVPAAVDAVVLRALQKERDRRFADGAEFAAALAAAAPTAGIEPPRADRARTFAKVLAAALLVLVVGNGALSFRLVGRLQDLGRQAVAALPAAGLPDRAELERLALADALSIGDRERLRAALQDAAVRGAAPPVLLGFGWLRLGALHRALREFERGLADGAPDAAIGAAIAWHCLHTALPAAAGAPPWFALADGARRDRLLRLGGGDGDADGAGERGDGPLLRACRELALGNGSAAWREVAAVAEAEWDWPRAAVALLAARSACAAPEPFSALAQRLCARFGAVPVLLAGLSPSAASEALLALAADAGADGEDRWLFEFAAAMARTLADGVAPPRLRAAAELAWIDGAGAAVPFWFAATRVLAAARGAVLTRDEERRLAALFAVRYAGAEATDGLARALLELAEPAAALAALREVPLPDEPAYALFHAWRRNGVDAAGVVPGLLRRGACGPANLPPATDAASALLHAAAAVGDLGDDADAGARRRAHWRQALAQPAALETLAFFAAGRDAALADLRAELAAAADAPPAGFVGALRLFARVGGPLGDLGVRFAAEVDDGVR